MDRGVGTILHQARNRRQIELSEVEAATRIRLRYLSAIENEEWDVLPGGVYTRGFIRTYASFLGLDGERLVEDYRTSVERWHRSPREQARYGDPGGGAGGGRLRLPLAALVVLAVIAVAVVAVVAIPGGGSSGGSSPGSPGPSAGSDARAAKPAEKKPQVPPPSSRPGVSVRLTARAEVWVCVLNGSGKALVDGQILQAGAEEGPFRSGSFTTSFGNGEVEMRIDGRKARIPATSSPVGYAIGASGGLSELEEAERPTCA
ncbi:MAG TPA: helix-turn-helix domain-containing protein [Solirubrobacterales bacterium]|nr:helix-turn-helix domain-containing protein [Solirubrobacterales bacterium]